MNQQLDHINECSVTPLKGAALAEPFISVIVPVRNEAGFIQSTLQQLVAQDYPTSKFEIIVADGKSTDNTCDIVREVQRNHGNVILIDNPGRLSSAGRNAAIRVAQGEYIVLVDGHCHLDDDQYLRHVVDAFQRSGADCLGRPQPQDIPGGGTLAEAIAASRASWLGHHSDSFIYSDQEQMVPPDSVAVVYRRELFDRLGGFDEQFDACEDVEFNHRIGSAGAKCFFAPSIQVRYFPRGTLPGLFRQLLRYGRGRVRLLRKHSSSFSVACFIPAVFVAGVLLGIPLCWALPALWPVYASACIVYLALVLVTSILVSIRLQNIWLLPLMPLVFFTIHAGAGCGVIAELLWGSGRRTASQHTPT